MKKIIIFLIAFISFLVSFAQKTITVEGTVTSKKDGVTLPGVSVYAKNTTLGTITDLNGYYKLSVPENATLVFSFVGMKTIEISIEGQTQINVEMEEMELSLGDIIVVGYTTESSKLISSSVTAVKTDDVQVMPTKTVDGILQGKAPGLQITQNSGAPGATSTVRIRGSSSINAGNQPLFIIDGIPVVTGNFSNVSMGGQGLDALSDLNPNDIESITVLKDASATAIYGARGANGVILITTKKGSQKTNTIDVNTQFGYQQLPPERKLKMLDAYQWYEYKGLTGTPPYNTDWVDTVTQLAPIYSIDISSRGGTEKTKYFLSGTYFNQDGIVIGTNYQRYSARLNLDHAISHKITIGASVQFSNTLTKRVEGDQSLNGVLPNAISIPAIYPVRNPDGTYNEDHFYANPVAIAENAKNYAYSNRFLGNVYLDYVILTGLTFSTKWGGDFYTLREHSYDPINTRQGAKYNGLGIESFTTVQNIVANNLLKYQKSIQNSHNFNVLLGQSFEIYKRRNSYIEAVNFPSDKFEYIASAGEIRAASASATDRALNSYFGQFKYNFKYKYIIDLTARYDGSSKFGKNYRYGFFPAVSLAWRVSEESFLKNNKTISELKIKASAGRTGNDGIGDFASLALFGGGANYNSQAGIAPIQLENPNLRWETTNQYALSIDLGLLKDKINFSIELYDYITHDLLLYRPLPPSTGYSSIAENAGKVENKGIEISFDAQIIDRKLKWNTAFNVSANRNKVVELNTDAIMTFGRANNLVRVGQPMGVFYGLRFLGVDPSTGKEVYDDINGDKMITSDDYTVIGNPHPLFFGGWSNTFKLGKWELSTLWQFSYGNDIYNGIKLYCEASQTEDNQLVTVLNRWKKPGDITNIPKVSDGQRWTSRFIEDGSYLKIRHITLSYTYKKANSKFNYIKFFVSVQNAYTFTNYSGMDPEINYAGQSSVILGTDFFTYPQSRNYVVGLSFSF